MISTGERPAWWGEGMGGLLTIWEHQVPNIWLRLNLLRSYPPKGCSPLMLKWNLVLLVNLANMVNHFGDSDEYGNAGYSGKHGESGEFSESGESYLSLPGSF